MTSDRTRGPAPEAGRPGRFRRLLRHIDEHGERYLLLWLYAFIVAVIFVEVIRRFVVEYSSLWGEETARYAFVYMVWIGAARAVKDRSHIRIDALAQAMPPRAAALLMLFGDVATIGFAGLAFYYSLDPILVSIKFSSVSDGLRIVKAWFLFAVPFGFSLIILRAVQAFLLDAHALLTGQRVRTGGQLFG